MDKVLSTIYLKVKSETQTLTKSAIAQILVKIIYSSEKRMSLKDIIASYKAFTNRKCVDEQIITELIENLYKTLRYKLVQRTSIIYHLQDENRYANVVRILLIGLTQFLHDISLKYTQKKK